MTLSPDDLAAMGERHTPLLDYKGNGIACRKCVVPGHYFWPCDSRRLLDEVEALRSAAQNAEVEYTLVVLAAGRPAIDFPALMELRRVLSEEVMTQTANEPST